MIRRYYDCHTHLFPDRRMGGLMRWIHRAIPDFSVPVDITADRAIADLRARGAVRWANLLFPIAPGEARSLHAYGAELAERIPEITPFGGVHAEDDDAAEVVEEALTLHGMAGLKFHPMVQGFDPWDPRLATALDVCEAAGAPIYIHTGYDDWYGHHIDRAGMEQMLTERPNLPVVLPHVGFPDLAWAIGLADRHPQVWLDLTNVPGSFAWMPQPDGDALRQLLHDAVRRLRDRVLVGTDYPAGMGNLDEILEQYESVGFPEDLLEHLMVVSTKAFFDRFGRPRT